MADRANTTSSSTTPKKRKIPERWSFLFVFLAFFIPAAAFPLADIVVRALWAGRQADTLPFPTIVLWLITGGTSVLINCAVIATIGYTDTIYLYYSCANITYILLFLCENYGDMTDAPAMSNVPPQAWRVNSFYFAFLWICFQLAFNSVLRRSGRSDEDLGAFGRNTQALSNFLSGSNGRAGGLDLPLAGNQAMAIGQSTVSPPAYEERNEDRNHDAGLVKDGEHIIREGFGSEEVSRKALNE